MFSKMHFSMVIRSLCNGITYTSIFDYCMRKQCTEMISVAVALGVAFVPYFVKFKVYDDTTFEKIVNYLCFSIPMVGWTAYYLCNEKMIK